MTQTFPTRFQDVQRWALQNSVTSQEAGRRYAQYLILQAMSRDNSLRNSIVFKGGNALEFVYLPNRSTTDLDFSFIEPSLDVPALTETIKAQLETTISAVNDGFGTVLRVQNVRQNPPGTHVSRPTLTSKIAYALPDQPRQRDRLLSGQPGANIVPVEMTVNEVVCEWTTTTIGDSKNIIQISTLNDIVAEKLRAILQQKSRNRYRGQDILDIASLCTKSSDQIDSSRVSDFLLQKSAARDVVATKSAFDDPEIAERAATVYDDLANTTRYMFIPFDEAWEIVMNLVDQLDIPD